MPKWTHGKRKTKYPGVSRLADGRWWIRAYATCPRTGKARETTRTLAAETTVSQVLLEQVRLTEGLEVAVVASAGPPRPTLADCAERWCEVKAARVRRSTAEMYATVLAKRVLPRLGELRLDQLRRSDIERWVAWSEACTMADGRLYSQDTLRGWWRVLCQFVRDACAEHGVPDPIIRVRPPRVAVEKRRSRRTLSARELGDLLEVILRDDPGRYVEVYVLAHTGMRPGELYALEWADVDEPGERIQIRRAVRHGVVGSTKTGAGREAALTPTMAELLREHRLGLVAAQHPGLARGLVFPSRTGGYRGPESLHKPLTRASEALGLDVRVGPLILRRTFNTLMVLEGVDRIVLRSQMGHCSEEMTERYAGVPVAAKKAAVEHLESRTR